MRGSGCTWQPARPSPTGRSAFARKPGKSFRRRSRHFGTRWPCMESSDVPVQSADPRSSGSSTPKTKQTTALAARPAASCSRIGCYRNFSRTTGRERSKSWRRKLPAAPQPDLERSAPGGVVLHPDAAAMRFGGQPAEHQTQATTGAGQAGRAVLQLNVLLEDSFAIGAWNSRSLVPDGEVEEPVGGACLHADRTAWRGVLEGVVQ